MEPAPEEDVNLAPEQKNEEAEKGVTVEIKWGKTRM